MSSSDGRYVDYSWKAKTVDDLLEDYFYRQFTVKQIQSVLCTRHNIRLSQRQIKRHLKRLKLRRRGAESSLDDIIAAVQFEVKNSSRSSGLRLVWHRLIYVYKLVVKRQTVRDIMDILMPGVLAERRRRRLIRRIYTNEGPNFLIHVDQYDKLSRFGFCIHGAMDGYSRKVLWLKVGNTNRDSATVAQFYLEYAVEISGLPLLVRVDGGTENNLMLRIQRLLRENGGDRFCRTPYFIGRSVHNQRIERFWSFLRCHFSQFWMELFQDLINYQLYNPDDKLQFQLLQFCFSEVIRNEIESIKDSWNHHRVRKMANSRCPSGLPDVIYSVPEAFGSRDFKQVVDTDILEYASETLGKPLSLYNCSDEFAEICLELMAQNNYYTMPENVDQGLNLYASLLEKMMYILET